MSLLLFMFLSCRVVVGVLVPRSSSGYELLASDYAARSSVFEFVLAVVFNSSVSNRDVAF